MEHSEEFKNKIAVITGSTQGLGEAIARLFAERGLSGLIICGRNRAKGEKLCKEFNTGNLKAYFVEADLDKEKDCKAIIAEADKRFGRVDVLVNVAGFTERGSIWDASTEHWNKMMNVNVRAPFLLIQGAINIMRREKIQGTVVNIGSVAAYGSVPFLGPYAVSKGALAVLTKNSAYAVMRDKIRINTLNIGWMDTPGEDAVQKEFHAASDDWLKEAEAKQPFGRLLKPKEVARAVAFLASEESGMMTGSVVDFDQSVVGAGPQPVPPPA